MIIEAAINFFAEEGFSGQTRALADRMGITHSVLYRYFPSKEALIERVYREVYLRRWDMSWNGDILNRKVKFSKRLRDFYRSYSEAIFESNWVRIFLYAGLKDIGISRKYYAHVRNNIVIPLCAELRADSGMPDFETIPLLKAEEELFWALHGGIFFLAVRKFVYGVDVPGNLPETVELLVGNFLCGAANTVSALLAAEGVKKGATSGRYAKSKPASASRA